MQYFNVWDYYLHCKSAKRPRIGIVVQATTTKKANEDIYNLMISQQNTIETSKGKKEAQELHDGVLGRMFV
jgi:hypothetical protein